LFAVVLAGASLGIPAWALDPARALSQYVHQAWGREQGLLGGTIYALSTSPDGYFWIGTDRGLVRFDGTRFDLIQQPIPGQPPIGRVRTLISDAEGTLWILPEGAHMLAYRGGHFADAFATLNFPATTITAMSLDRKGHVLFSGFGNVAARVVRGGLEPFANAVSVPGTVTAVAETLDGRIWMGTRDEGLFVVADGRVSRLQRKFADNKLNALLADYSGNLWVGTDHGLFLLTLAGEVTDPLPSWTHEHQILTLFMDRDACVWAGTDKGLIRITPAGQAAFRATAEDHASVNAVFQDHEMNLWFGGPGGLERLQDGLFSTYSSAEGFPAEPIGPIFADEDGGVWFAPLSGGLYWYQNGRLRQIRQDGLARDVIYSIDGGGGDVWVGRQRGGLTRIRRVGENLVTHTFTEKGGLAQNSVYVVHRSKDGRVWAGTVSGGISVFDGSGFKTFNNQNGLSSNAVNSIGESQNGSIEIATPGGLDELRETHWIHWTTQNGLPSPETKLCFADSHGVIWIATSGGLSYLSSGRIVTLRNLPDLMREQILGITEDHLGFLWFSTSDHVLRTNRGALMADSLHTGDLQSYGTSDGLAAIEPLRRERSMLTDSSGRIWISLNRGIASGEPMLSDRDSVPIQVRMDSVSANGKGVRLDQPAEILAGTRSMTFHFISDSLFAPDRVRFRYRLEDAEPDWTETVGSRQVLYNNLTPGNYRFRVIASRDGSLWNSPETVYSFSIGRLFWETWWFRVSCALAILLSIMFIMRLRTLRLAQQLNTRFQERLSERTRIAQELHDTLLQSFQGLMLRFQTVDTLLPARPDKAKTVLEDALYRADTALAESRNAIQNIRSSHSESTNIAQAINKMMAELAEEETRQADRTPDFEVLVEGAPKLLSPWVDSEVLRIAQESLRNAFQHARASRIEAEITFAESRFRIRFRDDGVGIDPEVLKKGSRLGHWGMIGLKERASRIGAKLEVWSKPGAGTELDLSVPGHIAYPGSPTKRVFRTLRMRFEGKHEYNSSHSDSDR
jgi:signal transduction histidine kinase/ligand-binding sensor domain-containing protein